jgi:hypothetical protein
MRRTLAAMRSAATDDFYAVLFISLAGLDLSLWLIAKGLALPM